MGVCECVGVLSVYVRASGPACVLSSRPQCRLYSVNKAPNTSVVIRKSRSVSSLFSEDFLFDDPPALPSLE